jgi:integrase
LPIALAVFTGLRTGEIRGLRWPDVNLARGTLIVRRSVSRGVEDTPKSGHERTVPLNVMLIPLLEEAFRNRTDARDEVCLTKDDEPWGEFGLNQAFKRAAMKSGISGYTFHCCRHFFITELFRQGVGAREIQRLAGHASLSTTQKYAHFEEGDSQRAIERLVVTGWQQTA